MNHIAGPWVCLNKDRVIQRCCVCGHSLINQRISETGILGDGDNAIPTYAQGDIIEVYGVNPVQGTLVGTLVKEDASESCPLFENVDSIPQLCIEP